MVRSFPDLNVALDFINSVGRHRCLLSHLAEVVAGHVSFECDFSFLDRDVDSAELLVAGRFELGPNGLRQLLIVGRCGLCRLGWHSNPNVASEMWAKRWHTRQIENLRSPAPA